MGIFFQNKEQYFTDIDMAKFVDFDEENSGRPSFLTSYFVSQIRQIKNYTLYTIDGSTVEAPDYISFKNYQQEHMYWWIIMIYNNLIDFSELTFGRQIKIPLLSDVNRLLSNLQVAETNYNNGNVESITLTK